MLRLLAIPLAALSFHSVVQPLSAPQRALLNGTFWHRGCPVALSDLRVLTVTHWGFDGQTHTGQLIVNAGAAQPLARVFRRLYALHFPIRDMRLKDVYNENGPEDVSGSFECRQAVPSPCVGGTGTGTWSMHAYGLAVDLNPTENPYIGCGMSRDPASKPYFDRSRLRPGMVTPDVIAAFRSIGWGWGGSWSGSTKDYMHFSSTGH
jgi:hypothetical protein